MRICIFGVYQCQYSWFEFCVEVGMEMSNVLILDSGLTTYHRARPWEKFKCDVKQWDSNPQPFSKRTLNRIAKLAKWLSCVVSTYLYGAFDRMFLSCLNGWLFIYELSGCGFESRCTHLNFRYRACFKEFLDIQATIECEFTLNAYVTW